MGSCGKGEDNKVQEGGNRVNDEKRRKRAAGIRGEVEVRVVLRRKEAICIVLEALAEGTRRTNLWCSPLLHWYSHHQAYSNRRLQSVRLGKSQSVCWG